MFGLNTITACATVQLPSQ